MRKYFKKYTLNYLIFCFATLILTFIIIALTSEIGGGLVFRDINKLIAAVAVCSTVFGLIAVTISSKVRCGSFSLRNRGLTKFALEDDEEKLCKEDPMIYYCTQSLKNKKKIKSITVISYYFIYFILFFAVGIVLLFWALKQHQIDLITTDKEPSGSIAFMVLACTLLFFSCEEFISRLIFVLRRTCFHCGTFYSFVEYSSDYKSNSFTDTRTVNRDIKVGEVKIIDKKENIYATVKERQTSEVFSSRETTCYKCSYCDNLIFDIIKDISASSWK